MAETAFFFSFLKWEKKKSEQKSKILFLLHSLCFPPPVADNRIQGGISLSTITYLNKRK